MKRILVLVAISLFSCSTAVAFQGGGGESTKKGSSKKEATKKRNSGTQSGDARAHSLTVDLGNNVKLELVLIKAGSYQMGSDKKDNEKPVHRMTISVPFYFGKYEVTQAKWQTVMGSNPSYFKDCGRSCPVDQVSWGDAQQFIKRLNARGDSHTYRLPTEAEWEYAARAGTTGDYAGNLVEMVWCEDNSGCEMHPVGQKKPNAWGLYDMHGNVWEWCMDYWHESYSRVPADTSAWVFRGGRSAFRGKAPDDRYVGIGFRVVGVARTP